MSDVQPKPTDQQPPVAIKGTSPWRLVLLLLVFGVALAGLLYDRCVARPEVQRADDTIQRLLSDTNADPNGDGTVTEDEVQSELGRKPASVTTVPNGKVERYSWSSGVPYRTYDLYVVYIGQQTPLLYSASVNKEPTGDRLPPVTIIPTDIPQGADAGSRMPSGVGMGAGGGGPQGAGGKGKGRGKKRSDSEGAPAATTSDASTDTASPDTPPQSGTDAAGQDSSSSTSQEQSAPALPQDEQPPSQPAEPQPSAEPATTPDDSPPAPSSDTPPVPEESAPQEGNGQ